jgi:hypothetical protein
MTLLRGVPVLSLSIGDAADFYYSRTSPEDMSSKAGEILRISTQSKINILLLLLRASV